eukprot:CAMPEP_0117684120 /NCGR_PEP_ID=MMETSP0804-20121206/20880_1 /TAXON_ID=1074897 /ORGANISM="Tetraselmis astigmatica, Strain CCMP880" /LENGTH=48 /DNA_ID= /DNA_START= /DNA_END= /DNA_ORIENTATION=
MPPLHVARACSPEHAAKPHAIGYMQQHFGNLIAAFAAVRILSIKPQAC